MKEMQEAIQYPGFLLEMEKGSDGVVVKKTMVNTIQRHSNKGDMKEVWLAQN